MSAVEPFVPEPPVRGFLHRPESGSGDALVLTHGASSNSRQALLVALCETFADAGFFALRCDLPFRQKRPTGPPSPAAAALDQAGLRHAVEAMRQFVPGKIFLGGHSYGGRQASILAASDASVADGLLLTSYPLHPPGRPDKPRTEHLARLRVSTLFVHGGRDPFGTLEEMRAALERIPAPTALMAVESGGHDLGFRKGGNLPGLVLAAFNELFR